MSSTDQPGTGGDATPVTSGRRRLLVTLTATATAVVTVAALGFVGLTTTPPAASAAQDAPAATAVPADLTGPTTTATPAAAPAPSASAATAAQDGTGSLADVRNVVLVLADDLDWNLFDQVPRLAALKDQGMTFTNFTVADSLCCPSRVSILRGQYIHNHQVVSNTSKTGGGWPTFRDKGWHTDCLPTWLQSAGVTTALYGKYLNEYPATQRPRSARYVPPGWSQWGVPTSRGDSYTGYDYTLNDNGRLVRYGSEPTDFLNDVITAKATSFIQATPEPFFLMLSTYNPHKPAPVAERHKESHFATVAPRTPNYNTYGVDEPSWLRDQPMLTPAQQGNLDRKWRQRAQSAESVADSIEAVLATLQATGRADDTLVIVTSDNGYHIGAHRLPFGKRTAFREDTVVPMIAIGPGVRPGTTFTDMAATIDLAPTIMSVLGGSAPAWTDGRSLVDVIATGERPASWRTATISESLGTSGPGDPDYQPDAPPQFTALRTPEWLFVVYRNGERELYNLVNDPYETTNVIRSADPQVVAGLYSQLVAMRTCTGDTCRTADTRVITG